MISYQQSRRGLLIILLIVFLLSIVSNQFFNKWEFSGRTFKARNSNGALIALNITSQNEKISGEGIHQSNSGEEHRVSLSGQLDYSSGLITAYESYTISGEYFGMLEGKFLKEENKFLVIWRDSRNVQSDQLNLIFTEKTPEEILASESVYTIKKNAFDQGKRVKEKITSFFEGLFSK